MYVIGLMSGTSVDGVDAALVEIEDSDGNLQVKLLGGETYDYPASLREKILRVCEGEPLSVAALAELDDAIAWEFAEGALKIQTENLKGELIASHGQTVYHRPPGVSLGYSVQLGRGALIAKLTGISCVSNFRAADIAAQGQGAPLVSKVDAYLLGDHHKSRCIQNIGGIGNVTYLPRRQQTNWEQGICGWDTGPGNALLDLAVEHLTLGKQTFDYNGNWARKGFPCQELVGQWLREAYFRLAPPKSTGRELFGKAYYDECWQQALEKKLTEADWLATLTELTAASIVDSYERFLPQMPDEVVLCGGGSYNLYLKERLQSRLEPIKVLTTDELGLNGAKKEAISFAVLGYWRYVCNTHGNLPQVTGAKKAMLLGEIHLPF